MERFLHTCVAATLRDTPEQGWFADTDAGAWFLLVCRITLQDSYARFSKSMPPLIGDTEEALEATAQSIVDIFERSAAAEAPRFPYSFMMYLTVSMLARYWQESPQLAAHLMPLVAACIQQLDARSSKDIIEAEYTVLAQ